MQFLVTNKDRLDQFYYNLGVTQESFRFSIVTEQEVLKILKGLNVSKSTGHDNISAKFLRDGANEIVSAISHIINLSLRTNTVPEDFKVARVVTLYKKGDRNYVGNFRPVSILPVISKIIERVVHNQISKYLDSNGLLFEHQSGFRQCHSTETTLTFLTDKIKLCIDKGFYTGLVMIDLQKAFDTVDHEILLLKLKSIGLNSESVLWFKSYLSNRMQFVEVNGERSALGSVTCGVPQGSILGPLLFLIYVNDMPSAVKCDLYLYADDSALMVSDKRINVIESKLEDNLLALSIWLEENKLSLHLGKTESILFGSKNKLKKGTSLNIKCNQVNIESKAEVKYLGCTIDNHLSGEAICSKIFKRVNGCIKFMYRKNASLGTNERKLLCTSLLQPLFDYAAISWFYGLSKKSKDKLQICQNKMMRCIFNLDQRSKITCNTFSKVKWLDVRGRVDLLTLIMVYKTFHGVAPKYMNTFTLTGNMHSYVTRRNTMSLVIPTVKSSGRDSFVFQGAKLWNSLPPSIRSCDGISSFKIRCKRYIFSQMYARESSEFIYY